MKNKTITITLIALLTLSSFGLLFTTFLTPAAASSNSVHPLEEMPLMDLTHKNFVEKEARASEVEPMGSLPSGQPIDVGEGIAFNVSDDGLGIDYEEDFVVVAEGEHILILVTLDAYNVFLGEGFYNFSNPFGNNSEPWLRYGDIITQDQIDYMVDEFDNNMYPTMEKIYGIPASRPADESEEEHNKVWTLLFNIRDDAYYDPEAESYIAGYFSLSDNIYYDKNLMHIDTYDWARRTGPDVDRPYLYEGVFAHEYEHMIHADIDNDEPSWVDEGLADLAGFFCGYGHSESHVAYYMVYHPMVSLIFWGGGLEDYGASYLFQLYLYEQFGGAVFTSALVQEQANGIEGIENTLAHFGYSETFDEIFDAWTIANYIDDTRKAGGKYGYETLDIGSIDSWGYTIEYSMGSMWYGPSDEVPFAVPSDWFFGISPQPYTAHYFRFTGKPALNINLRADEYAGTLAYSGTYEWYSDAAAWAWRSLYHSFAIPTGGATLNFYTFYEIEGDWDYGYVEVHDKSTDEWYTLDAPGTVDYLSHPQGNPNTPDGREPTDYEAAGRWHAFTGDTGGNWIPVSMDLTPFAGHDIDLYFTTWQDGAYTDQMMYVDDISIPEIGFFDEVEAGEGDWDSTGWVITDGKQYNHWGVTAMDVKGALTERYPELSGNLGNLHGVRHMMAGTISVLEQFGTLKVPATPSKSGRVQVAVVSNHADHILASNYLFWVI